ncbi:MAG: PKD domain-containing protein [Novosphingobium sp.]
MGIVDTKTGGGRVGQYWRLVIGSAALGLVGHAASAQAPGTTPPPATPALYSPDGDPTFAQPYVDIDEWRDAPVRHRYVHGGFKGTETRFSFYFPPKEQYQGHFFQYVTPVPDSENLAQGKGDFGGENPIAFSVASGAYFVETNGGGKFDLGSMSFMKLDPTISAYRANAASAAYSRIVAQRVYDTDKRPYGYAYGGSGGAFRTIGQFENTTGVWDGAVPFVMGSNMAIPNMFTVRIRAMRILGDKLDQVVDAASPGGSGDIYAGLTPLQADALREVTRMGFEPQSWFGWRTMGIHGFAALYQGVVAADPTYFTGFWTTPGYLGHDHPEQFVGARLQYPSTIAQVLTAADAARTRINLDASSEQGRGEVDTAFKIPEGADGARVAAFKLASTPPSVPFLGGDLIVKSGAAAGKRLPVARILGDIAVLGIADASVAAQLKPGDEVQLDNSNFLAAETYHRHQVPDASYTTWDQFRKADGTPLYPQRPFLIGPGFVKATGGSIQTGKWTGKMIVVESLWDREALPWQADWYRGQVRQHLGAAADQHYRLYYTDHALHGGVEDPSRIVSYIPVLQQALRDLSAWVEKGTPPPASTQYRIIDGQVVVPATAAQRKGIQPVVTLKANGGARAVVRAGQPVALTGTIAVPPGAGTVVAAEWDFDGKGKFPESSSVAPGARSISVATTHSFDRPGTYFPALRGFSQRQGDASTPYARIPNLGRVRVVVQ